MSASATQGGHNHIVAQMVFNIKLDLMYKKLLTSFKLNSYCDVLISSLNRDSGLYAQSCIT